MKCSEYTTPRQSGVAPKHDTKTNKHYVFFINTASNMVWSNIVMKFSYINLTQNENAENNFAMLMMKCYKMTP